MTTPRFADLTLAFAPGLLSKLHAHKNLDLNKHQASRLRESMSIDVRKLCDILVPEARHPEVSLAAEQRAAAIGVDLRQETWHSQPRFDSKRLVFHYEHMNPVREIVASLVAAETTDDVVLLIDAGLRLAWITKEEDLRLTALGYRSKRPDVIGAYEEAGIVLVPSLPDPNGHASSSTVPVTVQKKGDPLADVSGSRFVWTPDQVTITSPPVTPTPSDLSESDASSPAWQRHLKLAWSAGAGHTLEPPPDPTPSPVNLDGAHADDLAAYWAPLLQLLRWGLGWERPDRGLAAWRAQNYPTRNPVLALVHRWWGPDRIVDFLAWTTYSDSLLQLVSEPGSLTPGIDQTLTAALERDPVIQARHHDPVWSSAWEAFDPFDIVKHAMSPVESPQVLNPIPFRSHHGSVVVVTDEYAGWANLLKHYGPMIGDPTHGIDIFCREIGWLGHYRRSTRSGGWFREDELTHFMGN